MQVQTILHFPRNPCQLGYRLAIKAGMLRITHKALLGKTHLTKIGLLNEKPLHAALKDWYCEPEDRVEVEVDNYIIDIQRGDTLIELQTKNFSQIKRKVSDLSSRHPLRLVHPIAHSKWIIKLGENGESTLGRRKSPKQGTYFDIFHELVSFPNLIRNPNFTLHVLLIHEEELRQKVTNGSWRRRGWKTVERRLLKVIDSQHFQTPEDFARLLPKDLPDPFTTLTLAKALSKPRRLAQRMAFCLREMGAIQAVGRQGNAITYSV